MAIACEPKLLIADEPTTALDVTIQKQILDLIAELQKKHQMSVLFITHDLAVVGDIADHIVVMRDGEIREQGPAKDVFETAVANVNELAGLVQKSNAEAFEVIRKRVVENFDEVKAAFEPKTSRKAA